MKILQVLPYFNPKKGGDVKVCTNLSRELVKRGHDVTILTTDSELDNDYVTSVKNQGINVILMNSKFNISNFIYSPNIGEWLEKNIRKFDIVHLHTYRAYQNNIICKYSIKFKIPYIVQAHGSVLPFFQKQLLKQIYDKLWGHKILNNASTVIALNEMEKEQYKKMGIHESKIEIVYNGIDLSILDNLPEKGKFRQKYLIHQNEKVILYLGRIHKIKGIDLLLDAFSDILKELHDVRLVIVGPDDGFLETIEKHGKNLIQTKDVLIIGPLYNVEKWESYIDADVYVLPSFYETFPNTVIEACASSTPVVLTDRCGISDIIRKNNLGFVVEYDKDSLTNTLIKLLKNDKLRKKLSNNCTEIIKKEFDLNNIINQFEELYQRCAIDNI